MTKPLIERFKDAKNVLARVDAAIARNTPNALPPSVARAFQELKATRTPTADVPPPPAEAAPVEEVVYPLDAHQRELVLEIERVGNELRRDLSALKARGAADDILQATCAKLLARAKESLTRSDSPSEFAARYLDMTRNSLVTAYRQVRARLTRVGG